MKIIFLDIDGVLNSIDHLIEMYTIHKRAFHCFDYPFDRKCLNNLKEIVNQTDSYIVVTSTWRTRQEGRDKLLEVLNDYNLDERIVGYTPKLSSGKRGQEIKTFLNETSLKIDDFVILDDNNDMEDLITNLVLTNPNTGMTKENAEEAINILNKKSLIKKPMI